MTKILVWNIQQFSINKINTLPNNNNKQKKLHGQLRLDHILNTLRSNQPDIFSVLEVQPGNGRKNLNNGDLVTHNGIGHQGCLYLLNAINNDPVLGQGVVKPWRIVPPLVSGAGGRTEGVAVFYNSSTVQFIGPLQWKGGAYPAPWNNINIASGGKEAAQIAHYQQQLIKAKNFQFTVWQLIDFPTAQHRSPYLTQFKELKGHQRTIDLYSIHTSPKDAVVGTANIALITDLQRQLNKDEVIVIAGDFNVTQDPSFKVNGVTRANDSYGKLTDIKIGFTQEFDAAKIIPAPGGGVTKYHYVTTHLRPRKTKQVQDPDWKAVGVKQRKAADPWGDYPPYGYMSSAPEDTLDNIFTKYPMNPGNDPVGNPYPTQSQKSMIVNRVVGAPYNVPPPGGIVAQHPQGLVQPYPVDMNLWVSQVHAGLRRDQTRKGGLTSMFRGFNNYGKIRLTSDHMAVYVEI